MNTVSSHRAYAFYAIALGLAVLVSFAVPAIGEASLFVTMLTPAVAVILMLTLVSREGGLRKNLESLGLFHVGIKGWPLAIGGPVLIQLAGLVILVSLGLTTVAASASSAPLVKILVNITAGSAVGTFLGLCEEVGWRGYMLPRMNGKNVLAAMLFVGFLHGVWHLPLMLTTDYYHATGNPWLVAPLFLLTLTLAGVFYGFLRIWTVSIWPVAVAHAAVNMAWNITRDMSQTKSPVVLEYIGGESGLIMIAGLIFVDTFLVLKLRNHLREWQISTSGE